MAFMGPGSWNNRGRNAGGNYRPETSNFQPNNWREPYDEYSNLQPRGRMNRNYPTQQYYDDIPCDNFATNMNDDNNHGYTARRTYKSNYRGADNRYNEAPRFYDNARGVNNYVENYGEPSNRYAGFQRNDAPTYSNFSDEEDGHDYLNDKYLNYYPENDVKPPWFDEECLLAMHKRITSFTKMLRLDKKDPYRQLYVKLRRKEKSLYRTKHRNFIKSQTNYTNVTYGRKGFINKKVILKKNHTNKKVNADGKVGSEANNSTGNVDKKINTIGQVSSETKVGTVEEVKNNADDADKKINTESNVDLKTKDETVEEVKSNVENNAGTDGVSNMSIDDDDYYFDQYINPETEEPKTKKITKKLQGYLNYKFNGKPKWFDEECNQASTARVRAYKKMMKNKGNTVIFEDYVKMKTFEERLLRKKKMQYTKNTQK